MSSTRAKKLSYKEFIESAIRTLLNPKYKRLHVVFSGFNDAFRQYYGEDPRPVLDKLAEEGFLNIRPARGGATIALGPPEEKKPANERGRQSLSAQALAKILSDEGEEQ